MVIYQGFHASSNLLNFYIPPQNSSDLPKKVDFLPKSPQISSKKFQKVKFFLLLTIFLILILFNWLENSQPLSKTSISQYYYQSILSCLRQDLKSSLVKLSIPMLWTSFRFYLILFLNQDFTKYGVYPLQFCSHRWTGNKRWQ